MLPIRNVQLLTLFSGRVMLGLTATVVLGGCPKGSEPEAPKKVARSVDTKKIPVPNHSPEVMSDPGKPRRVGVTGKMEALVSGRKQQFTFFSRGLNAAAVNKKNGVAWLKIRGALTTDGEPFLELSIDNFNLDEAEFPVTITAAASDPKAPKLTTTYGIDAVNVWKSKPGPEATSTVVITSFDGKVVKGSFEASIPPRSAGNPLELKDGKFEIELRLNGVGADANKADAP